MTHSPRQPQYFFIIGAMKAGTTSLYNYLADHPQLYASPKKEPRVFRDPADEESLRTAFLALFEGRRDEAWCFEGSTAYTKYPHVPGVVERLHAVVPDARFVYLVRNPVERTWSHYVHNVAQGRERRTLTEALAAGRQYLDFSRYHMQLEQYCRVFPRDRILVQVFEEMTTNPEATVRAVTEFLGVDSSYRPCGKPIAHNASGRKRAAAPPLRVMRRFGVEKLVPWRVRHALKQRGTPLPDKQEVFTHEVRARVTAALQDDVDALFGLLGRRIPGWSDFA